MKINNIVVVLVVLICLTATGMFAGMILEAALVESGKPGIGAMFVKRQEKVLVQGEVIMDNSLQGERFELDNSDFRGTVNMMVVEADVFYSKEEPEMWYNTTVNTIRLVTLVERGKYQIEIPAFEGNYYQIVYLTYFPYPGIQELSRDFTYFGATQPEKMPADREAKGPTFFIAWV